MSRVGIPTSAVTAATVLAFVAGFVAPASAAAPATVQPAAPFTLPCINNQPCPSLVPGTVQHHPLLYVLFWGPQWAAAPLSGDVTTLDNFFRLLSASNWAEGLERFSDSKGPIQGITYGGSFVDTAATPVITDGTIDSSIDPQIRTTAASQHWNLTPDTTVVVFTQPGASKVSDCGFNGTVDKNEHFAWATYPTDPNAGTRNCIDRYPNDSTGTNSPLVGDLTFEATHELSEAATSEPPATGWTTSTGGQIADACNGLVAPFDQQSKLGTYVQYLQVPGEPNCVNYQGLESPPNPSGSVGSLLDGGVSCPNISHCVAVGRSIGASGPYAPLAEVWNGSYWAIQPTPNPAGSNGSYLTGVSCPLSISCTAVGYYLNSSSTPQPLADVWNGTHWVLVPPQVPSGSTGTFLNGVSCPATNSCTAVGYYFNTAHDIKTLAEFWNGSAWSVRTTPNPAGSTDSKLLAVACLSATACTAVGSTASTSSPNTTPIADVWNGTAWSAQHVPKFTGGLLVAVSCSATTACTAVGQFLNRTTFSEGDLVASWNGKIWFYSPTVLTNADLYGVSCTRRNTCTAVGQIVDTSGNTTMMIENPFDDGNVQPVPIPLGSTGTSLDGVTCTATSCTMVGSVVNGSGTQTLALRLPPV